MSYVLIPLTGARATMGVPIQGLQHLVFITEGS